MLLNWADLSIQMFTNSMARSKFFTYSPYIFRKGASFWRMSPIRGFESLHTGGGKHLETYCSHMKEPSEEEKKKRRSFLTTPPSVSAAQAAETADGNSRWSKCWRRFPERRHRGRRSETGPPLGVWHRKPAGGADRRRFNSGWYSSEFSSWSSSQLCFHGNTDRVSNVKAR